MNLLQKQAAEAPNGYVQIVAGPGTGKTVTLIARVVELIERGINPRRICVLSFTRAAARELKLRVAERLGANCDVIIGTFHSIAYRFCRRFGNGQPLGLLDDTEKREILGKLVADSTQSKAAMRLISRAQVFGISLDSEMKRVYDQYTEITTSMGKVDYDGLLSLFYELLKQSTRPQDSLDAVLVDEFQDTSVLQLKIALSLASTCQNLTVVGDPDQSIYSFRNAEPKTFHLMCSMAEAVQQYCLESNYRSSQPILNAAHKVIMATEARYAPQRKLKSECSPTKLPVRYCQSGSSALEAMNIAEHISHLVKSGVQPSEICVLSRHSASYRGLESELVLRNIKSKLVGGRQIAMSPEVRAIVDYLRVALDNGDRLAISRTLNYPSRKIGPQSARQVSSGAGNLPQMDLIRQRASDPRFREYIQFVDQITQVLGDNQDQASVEEAIRISASIIDAETAKVDELQHMVGQFASMIAEDQDPEEDRSFAQQFVSLWALGADQKDSDAQSCVTLSTIHSAKGLEWPIVILVGASQDPIWRQAETEESKADAEHEESRLLYVALTRAKYYLMISSPSMKFDPKLACNPKPGDLNFDINFDLEKLSLCLGRDLVAEPLKSSRKTAPTQLGKGIELVEGFVLASELPIEPRYKPEPRLGQNEPRKVTKSTKKNYENTKKKETSILSFFRPTR